jgi:hypothetical protein
MVSGREVKRSLRFGALVLFLGVNLVADSSVVCKGGKCIATILKKEDVSKKGSVSKFKIASDSSLNGFDVKKKPYFIPLDDNEVDSDEDIIIQSMEKVKESPNDSNILFKAHKIYACDDDYTLVCEKPENKDKEVCECIS